MKTLFKVKNALAGTALIILLAASAALNAQGRAAACTLKQVGKAFNGPCELLGRQVEASLSPPVTGDRWVGRMQGKYPEDPTEFEIVNHRNGVGGIVKTPFGWFPLESLSVSNNTLTVAFNTVKQVPPSGDDIRIIQRALDILADDSKWNRQDDRQCQPRPVKWSVFCALIQATEENVGSVHYRQPALQAVREVLNEVGGSRVKKHRLMDYNNHPDTTLRDIHDLLQAAAERVRRQQR